MKERNVVIDIDNHVDTIELINVENLVNLNDAKIVNGVSPNPCKNTKKEKRKSKSGNKKHPKPPRPPRGLSLDAFDHKLIKEISELAMIKRARIERMKSLKKTRGVKALTVSGSSSSSGNVIAMVFTVLFCVVIIFQGCHSSGVFSRNNTTTIVNHGSPNSNEATPSNIIPIKDQRDLTATSLQNNAGSSALMDRVSGSYSNYGGRRMLDK